MEKKNLDYITTPDNKDNNNIPEIGIGVLGCGFIGSIHSNSYINMPYRFSPPPAKTMLVNICDINKEEVSKVAKRFGYMDYCTDWKDLINDKRVDIFVNAGPNNIHAEACIEAAKAGKNIVCEKPLGRNANEAKLMLDAVNEANVKNLCNFSYRMIPALTLAKELIMDGKIGKIYQFRANFLKEYIINYQPSMKWRLDKETAGSGALGDLGSHIIDIARWLCGEPVKVIALTKKFTENGSGATEKTSQKINTDVDDAFISIIEFENGAIGALEGSGYCRGRRNYVTIEINGELGSIYFNIENMNFLHVYFKEEDNMKTKGFHAVNVTEPFHPYHNRWVSHIGWEDMFIISAYNMVNSVINNVRLEPMVGTFEDGYKAMVICDAILKSADSGKKEHIEY